MFIHPDECVDCGACVVECPVDAIFHEDDVPEEHQGDIELNRKMSMVRPNFNAS